MALALRVMHLVPDPELNAKYCKTTTPPASTLPMVAYLRVAILNTTSTLHVWLRVLATGAGAPPMGLRSATCKDIDAGVCGLGGDGGGVGWVTEISV
jgi:hypothetical protein